jgi:helix-turn-helix protein
LEALQEELIRLRDRVDLLERARVREAEWLNETQASRYIGKNEEFLRRLRLEGKGPPATRIGRRWMRKRSDLDKYMSDPNSHS